MFGRYDQWRTRESNPGTGDGRRRPLPTLRCTGCAFRGDVSAAVAHWQATGHPLTYRGHVQDFAAFAVTQEP